MCLRSVEGVGDAVELGGGILAEDLLDDPPEGGTVGDVIMHTARHSRVQDGEPVAVAREDERARIAAVRKVARSLTVVVEGHFPRLESEFRRDIGCHTRVAAQGKFGRVAVLANNVEGVAVLVLRVGIGEVAASENTADGELKAGWDPPALADGSDGPKEPPELTGGALVS